MENWADIMSDILKVKLPWLKLRPYLAPDVEILDGMEHVNFRKFLARYVIDLITTIASSTASGIDQ